MRSVNYALRKRYFSLLNGIVYNSVPIKAFYQKSPDNLADANYIVFGGISSSDNSSKYKSDTQTSINVTVHSYKQKFNDGADCDGIANLVLQAIYPNRQVNHDLSGDSFQVVTTELLNDNTREYSLQNEREFIDRTLTFTHKVFHK